MKSKKKITLSDLRRQAEAMLADGTMPNLEAVLEAVAEVRAIYQPLIREVRQKRQTKASRSRGDE